MALHVQQGLNFLGRLGVGQHHIRNQAHHRTEQLLGSLLLMAWFVEARDPYTGGHLWRVSRYAQLVGEALGFSDSEIARVGLGGFLHDLGKVGIPDAILRKPGALDEAEYQIIRTHPDVGLRMLSAHPLSPLVEAAVHLHHERPDGQGYPLGLRGGDIPLVARVVGLCDALDAMTSHRPYRAGMSLERALEIIENAAGRQFDAALVPVLGGLLESGELQCIQGHSDAGIRLQDCLNCGPIIQIRRRQRAGELVWCPNCSGEYRLLADGTGEMQVEATGGQGTPEELEPQPDHEMIAELIDNSVRVLPVEELLDCLESKSRGSAMTSHRE